MRIDYGGAVIPWYERPLAGGFNYIWEEKPPDPPPPEVQQYVANETYIQEKMQEGDGGIGGFLTNVVNPILDPMAADPIKTAAMLAAAVFAPELIPIIAGADTAIAGGTPEDVIKSAAKAYVTQAIGSEIGSAIGGGENIGLPSETPYVDLPDGEVLLSANVPPPALPDDASRLAQMLKEFENPREYGPTIDVASKPSVTLENVIDTEVPLMPSNMQSDILYRSPLTDFSPNVPIQDLSQELDITGSMTNPNAPQIGFNNTSSNINTNIGQVGGGIIGSYIGGGTGIGGTGVKPNLSAGELTVSGNRDTFDPWDNPEPPPYEPYEDNYPTQPDETVDKTTTQSPKIKLGNLLTSTSALPKLTQQQYNLANALRGSQMPQSLLPSIYKQANPFNFGQQASPVQDTNALVKLLRTA
jgi:hypothetical protein